MTPESIDTNPGTDAPSSDEPLHFPVEELRLYVTHPPGFQVWATSMHPDEAELFSDTAISKGWALWGLIPGQGLAFMWRRVQPCHQASQGTDGMASEKALGDVR